MKALLLAAGYGTRMGPLRAAPKALLEVAGEPILTRFCRQLAALPEIGGYLLVTNKKFRAAFDRWRAELRLPLQIEIIDDGTERNEDRLGAIGDLHFAIRAKGLDEDLLVAGTDNVYEWNLRPFVEDFLARRAPLVAGHRTADQSLLHRTGVAEVDGAGRIIGFVEKPAEPRSDITCPPLYCYPRAVLPACAEYVAAGQNLDAPGQFIAWLHRRLPTYLYLFQEPRFDIGSPKALDAVREKFLAKK